MNLIRINPNDNVAVALDDIAEGSQLNVGGINIVSLAPIKRGHKIALSDIKEGENIIKYGVPIAHAKCDIKAGEWVHTHNVSTNLSENADYHYDHKKYVLPEMSFKSFQGYVRPDGKVGVRNELWVIPIVGCVNDVASQLAYQNQDLVSGSIDGLYSFRHPFGCSQLGGDLMNTRKILTGLAKHPNAGGVLLVALGCENLTLELFKEGLGEYDENRIKFLVCQDHEDEFSEGRKLLMELAEYASRFHRETCPASKLVVGM